MLQEKKEKKNLFIALNNNQSVWKNLLKYYEDKQQKNKFSL